MEGSLRRCSMRDRLNMLARRTMRGEALAMMAVFGVTAALISYAPPIDAASGPFSINTSFGPAELEMTVVSSDGKKVEKVSLAKSGSDWLARRDGDASFYVIPSATVDEFDHAAADLKEDQSKPPAKK